MQNDKVKASEPTSSSKAKLDLTSRGQTKAATAVQNSKSNTYHPLRLLNRTLFPILDSLDRFWVHKWTRRLRLVVFAGMTGALGWLYYRSYILTTDLLSKQENGRSKLLNLAQRQLEPQLHQHVLQNAALKRMIVDMLVSGVYQNPRIEFILARNLGRVIHLDNIKTDLKVLVKDQLLKDHVFYSDDTYGLIKKLIVQELQGPLFKLIVTEQITKFGGSEAGRNLADVNLAETLKKDVIVSEFVAGVVDNNVYKQLADKENARKLDKQLYDIFK